MSLRRHMTATGMLVMVVILTTVNLAAQEAKVPVQDFALDN